MPSQVFVTVQDCVTRLGKQLYELLGVEQGADVANNAKLLAAIATANDRICASLRVKKLLPLSTVPASLVSIGIDIVRWNLVGGRPETESQSDADRYAKAEALLDKYASGKASPEAGDSVPAIAQVIAGRVKLGGSAEHKYPTDEEWVKTF